MSRTGAPFGSRPGSSTVGKAIKSRTNRLTDNSQDALVASLKLLQLKPDEVPLRPGFGTVGKAVELRTNFFPIKIPKGSLFEYELSIFPDPKTMRRVKRRIFQLAETSSDWDRFGLLGNVAHDHSTKLIAARLLPQPLSIRVPFFEEDETAPKPGGKEYVLTIEFARIIDTSTLVNYLQGQRQYRGYDILPIISALNVVLAAFPNRSGGEGVPVGRNRFFFKTPDLAPVPLGGGLEAWKGFYSSVRPAHNQLMVNVNVCTTVFYRPGNLADAMNEFMDSTFGASATAFAKGVHVQTKHLGCRKIIKAISNHTARSQQFDCGLDREVTIEEYFRLKHKITLENPNLPLVDVGGKKKTAYLPLEVCIILPNQAFKGKLTDEHTAIMLTDAAKRQKSNPGDIVKKGFRELGFNEKVAPQLKAFDISIKNQMAVVPGRILPSPGIEYATGTPAVQVDERGSWNLRGVKLSKGARLADWAVLLIKEGNDRDEFASPQDPELMSTVRGFAAMCKKMGMTVDQKDPVVLAVTLPQKVVDTDPTRAQAVQAISDTLTSTLRTMKKNPSIVIVILANEDRHVYNGVKHLCDVSLDLPTVCVQSSKIRKEKGHDFYANVVLKFNMKLGGVNHSLDERSMTWLKQMPTMLVGIDVMHPGSGSIKGAPSIAAVVASYDGAYAQFPCSLEIQESRKEMVTSLDKMVEERLTLYHAKNKHLPKRIMVYRVGVSEDQFPAVIEEELPAIRRACKKFDKAGAAYQPKITIVICGKRHHTRFYPTEKENNIKGNPRPGTVVDRGITSVYNFDFFLQAHGGLEGTARPTHYYVVHDDMRFQANELQSLTNAVCFMFARATSAVSMVSPAYYAYLACERGRCYLDKLLSGISSSGGSIVGGSDESIMCEAREQWKNGVTGAKLKDTMFYL